MLKGFKCTRCGSCCYPPRLYQADIKKIEKAGYKDFVYEDNLGKNYLKDKKGSKCMFLKKKGKIYECTIYPYRPRICRLYPSRLLNGSCKPEKLKFDEFLEKK
jgi:Fe-S-cluster containining protein